MSRVTQTYKKSFSGSIGSGLGSVFGSSGKQYYILEHKSGSKYHKAGEAQEIIVNEIEMGRASGCQVRFDESFTTVSRRHAAIVKEGGRWKLIQLSNTNPTLLNGNPVSHEWYLQNGDEIQLSVGGPKLGFIIPAGKTMGSIGLTRRMNLFAHQALRPYKWAIAILGTALILAIAGLSTWKYFSDKESQGKIATLGKESKAHKIEVDSLATVLEKTEKDLLNEKARNKKIQADFEQRLKNFQAPSNAGHPNIGSTTTGNTAIDACQPYVYFVYVNGIEIILPNGEHKSAPESFYWTGTGFLLDDGRFVTARHVVEPWFFIKSETDSVGISMNYIANNGGKIIVHFNAISSSGDRLSFTSDQVFCNRSHDGSRVTDDGDRYVFARLDNEDWAYFQTSKTGGLTAGKSQSVSLGLGTELTILGFPFMLGANSPTDIKPLLSKATAAKQGLDNGVILTTNSTFEQGNSGGPVFYTDSSGRLIVVGIVSAGAGRSTGAIVPIASIY